MWRFAIIAFVCLGGFTRQAIALDSPTTSSSQAAVIKLDGAIDEFNKHMLFKRFAEARQLGATTIILQINTYGGLVTSGLDISRFLKQQNDLHIIAFVDEKAISAGAMIALACNEIVMEPGSLIGDCAPISVSESGLQTMGAAERAKAESPILADFEDSAKRNGYDALLVQSMVSVGRVVHWMQNSAGERRFVDQSGYEKLKQDGWNAVSDVHDPVDAGDTLLTLSAETALKLGLAKSIQPSPSSLAAERTLTIVETFSSSAGELLIGFFGSTAVRGILTTIFLVSLYAAFSHPGHGMPEVIAVSTLGLILGVPLLTGYAQWWEIVAIMVGLILIALEVFVIPGFGITGISGIALVMIGLIMTWVGREPNPGFLPTLQGTWTALMHGMIVVVSGMVCSLGLWVWLQRFLPSLPYFNRLILTTTSGTLGTTPSSADSIETAWPPLGSRGRAVTDLRPGGSAAFHDSTINDTRITDVVSDSGFVRAGADIVVREVHGNRIIVRASTT